MELIVAVVAFSGLGVLAHFFGYDSRETGLADRAERAIGALRDGDAGRYTVEIVALERELSRSRDWTIR